MTNLAQVTDGDGRPIPGEGYDSVNHQFAMPQLAPATTDSTTQVPYAPQIVQQAAKNAAIAAGTGTTPVVIKASPGYLKAFVVTTTATAAMTFYDNASAASGTVLYTTSTTIAAGTIIVLDMPFMNGLTVSQASGSAAVTVAYS